MYKIRSILFVTLSDLSKLERSKKLILLFATLVTIPILFTYLVFQTPQSLLAEDPSTLIQGDETLYTNKVILTISRIESISKNINQFGTQLVVSNTKITYVTSNIDEFQSRLSKEKDSLEQLTVPPKFNNVHPYLITSIENMQNSNELLISAFQKFENIRNEKLPMYLMMLLLSSDQTSLLPLYKMLLINQEEKAIIEEARMLFDDSMKESTSAKENLDFFISNSGINLGDVKITKAAKGFDIGDAGCLSCILPISVINSNKTN